MASLKEQWQGGIVGGGSGVCWPLCQPLGSFSRHEGTCTAWSASTPDTAAFGTSQREPQYCANNVEEVSRKPVQDGVFKNNLFGKTKSNTLFLKI